ncbi:MAG: serine/threonine-protein kinase [Myxococcaceae bacterium]
MSERRFGNYDILSKIGEGGVAEVYRARAVSGPLAGQEVALKRLSPALAQKPADVARFVEEGRLALSLSHPNIVRTFEAGEKDGIYFLVMERIDGRDLGQVLRRCAKRQIALPIDFAVFLVTTLLSALSHAHSQGVVHGDVSPSNVFISRVGDVKLGDFGSARGRATVRQDAVGVVGKPFYLSPEAFLGAVTTAADLWAAGVMLYEMVAGARPYGGAGPEEVREAALHENRRPLAAYRQDVSRALEVVVARALSRMPSSRYTSAQLFAEALAPHWDERVGTPLAIAAVVRGLFAGPA